MKSLPNDFLVQIQNVLNDETSPFLDSLNQRPRPSIRLNPKKVSPKLPLSSPVGWASNAFYLDSKPSFTLDPYFHAGHYYVQEASSMILEKIIDSIKDERIISALDLCAAPGGKTTHLIDLLPKNTIIHAHEVQAQRAEILRQNLEKWGRSNIIVSTGPIRNIVGSGMKYALVIVDAPCSGEGMFRKEPEAVSQWSLNKVNHCTKLQKEILHFAQELLEPGGYLLYSTCTYNQLENEGSIEPLIHTYGLESIRIPNLSLYGVLESEHLEINTYRCLPHKMEGEGFTFSLLRKPEGITPKKRSNTSKSIQTNSFQKFLNSEQNSFYSYEIHHQIHALSLEMRRIVEHLEYSKVKILSAGIPIGITKGKDSFPAHGLSQNIEISTSFYKISLDLNMALHYLRADNNFLPLACSPDPWQLIVFEAAILGWVKNIQGKLKNYLPKNQRIHSL